MSATEREALDAGTVWWDGELFTGGPDWQKLMSAKTPALTPVEQAFLDGPCEELCAMLDDWDITHGAPTCPPAVWAFIKSQGLLRDDHSAALRRTGIFGICPLLRADQNRFTLGHRILDHRGAQLPGARGTAAALRHRGAKKSLPAAAGARRGCSLFRADRARAPDRTPPPSPTPASSARDSGRARKSSASASISRSATSPSRRSPR